jgi:hypothetical protein
MAEVLISPGVLARENDSSFVNKRPVTVGAAIIGPTVKGPVEIPTVVTTWNQYQNIFGTTLESGSVDEKKNYTYFTSITAYNYFANGGQSLLVARVVSGSGTSYTPATSSTIATGSGGPSSGLSPFVLETFSEGIIMNSTSTETAGGNLPSGSSNNVRWQIVNARSASGTFDLLIRRGNDGALQPVVLETWTNLTLDPNSPNYISRVIGDFREIYDSTNSQIAFSGSFANRSNYVRVSAVNYTTPNFFDNAGKFKPQFTGSIPLNASGTFGGAIGDIPGGVNFYNTIGLIGNGNSQGVTGSDYANMIDLFTNTDDYKFNVLFTPGLYSAAPFTGPVGDLIQIAQNRGDFIYVIDPVAYGKTISDASSAAGNRDTSYGAMYWPWIQVVEPSTGEYVWVPASVSIAGVYAYNDSVAEPWFAPAGINRGGLNTVVRAEKKLSQGNRNDLYAAKVNPIATFPGQGVVVYGQKTLQLRASALDRVNVRRLLIALKSYISQIATSLVFEQNSIATRTSFLSQVNPYLTSVQQRQGLYAFKVIMDDTNNTPDVIDRNELIGQIYLQPTKTAEFIYLDFNVTPTGASFPA